MNRTTVLIVGALIIAVGLMLWRPADTEQTTDNTKTDTGGGSIVYGATIPGAHFDYNFSANLPAGWKAEAVPAIEAINLYSPTASGENNLEKSQIFIRKFTARNFETLTTVDILDRKEVEVVGRPAVQYEIKKKGGIANFPNQPQWRNEQHIVTDIRVSDGSPSLFYVIARNPKLSEQQYQAVLTSLRFNLDAKDISWVSPIDEFKQRITKKPFGVWIDPATSPIQPERFTGFHTAVDVEYADVEAAVGVRAIGNGRVVLSRTAEGYGGVFVVQHPYISNFYTLYGHIDPASLPRVGTGVTAGQVVGTLAPDHSDGSGGERKHLHFGAIRKSSPDIAGYVGSESALSGWMNPLELFD